MKWLRKVLLVHDRVEWFERDKLRLDQTGPRIWLGLWKSGVPRGILRRREVDANDGDPEGDEGPERLSCAVKWFLTVLIFAAALFPANAQNGINTVTPSMTVDGFVRGLSTVNASGTITSGATFQQILPSIIPNAGNASTARQSLTIQNNNTNSDNCWVFFGPIASATEAGAVVLAPQQSYGRYWPDVPTDTISITCSGTSDTFYADYQ